MNPGLPGTGIGGLFYIVSALAMPIFAVWRRYRGEAEVAWRVVALQVGIALGVVLAMTVVFWGLDSLLAMTPEARSPIGVHHDAWSLRVSALMVTSGVLSAVLGAVQVLRLVVRLGTPRSAAQ